MSTPPHQPDRLDENDALTCDEMHLHGTAERIREAIALIQKLEQPPAPAERERIAREVAERIEKRVLGDEVGPDNADAWIDVEAIIRAALDAAAQGGGEQ